MKIRAKFTPAGRKLTSAMLAFFVLLGFASSAVASSSELRVLDCEGNLRLIEVLDDQKSAQLLASVPDEAMNRGKTATLKGEGVTFEQKITSKTLSFSELSSGQWTLCSNPDQIAFENLRVVTKDQAASGSTLRAAAAIAAVGGAIALPISLSSSSNDSAFRQTEAAGVTESGVETPGLEVLPENIGLEDKVDDKCLSPRSRNGNVCFIGDDDNVVVISPFQ
jgi:hypothetical protein